MVVRQIFTLSNFFHYIEISKVDCTRTVDATAIGCFFFRTLPPTSSLSAPLSPKKAGREDCEVKILSPLIASTRVFYTNLI